jgi:predicted AAA+ superfamily ATPase
MLLQEPRSRLLPRGVAKHIAAAMDDTPVVLVNGPRQCGKTTLVRTLEGPDRTHLTLDDDTTLNSVPANPTGFIRDIDEATIDEVQRAPDLLRAIKRSVDEDRRPGRFLLTGSANILTIPTVAESLAGRMETVPHRFGRNAVIARCLPIQPQLSLWPFPMRSNKLDA